MTNIDILADQGGVVADWLRRDEHLKSAIN